MKKLILALSCILFAGAVSSQTIVSTQVEKRNAVIEEYTGTYCGYCPLGHYYVNQFAASNPGRVVPINIHAGSYAAQYGTVYGNNILAQANVNGFPALSINRQVSSCKISSSGATSYNTWAAQANNILNENSPINVAATATVDYQTRQMSVLVEVYYTADVAQEFNSLNIYLLQDNVLGEQHIYGDYNPDQTIIYDESASNSFYKHEHMFRDIITPEWGDSIAREYAVIASYDTIIDTTYTADSTMIIDTTINSHYKIPAGTFVSKTYTYEVPQAILDWCQYQDIERLNTPVEIADINLAVFVADGQSSCDLNAPNIYTGVSVKPTITNYNNTTVDFINLSTEYGYGCDAKVKAQTYLRVMNAEGASSIKFEYGNRTTNQTDTFTWTGNIASTEFAYVDIPNYINVNFNQATTIFAKIVEVNGQPLTSDEITTSVTLSTPDTIQGTATLILKTDKYGSEVTWDIKNSDGDIIVQGGPYTDGAARRDTVVLDAITTEGCYVFTIYDSYGDGCTEGGKGIYKIKDQDGNTVIINNKGDWGAKESAEFYAKGLGVGLNDANENIFQSIIYPNPTNNSATLSLELTNSCQATISVVDIMGKEVIRLNNQNLKAGRNDVQLNVQSLEQGTYFVRVISNNGMTTNKLTVVK